MSLRPKTYESALAAKQAADARRRVKGDKPRQSMKRTGRLKAGKKTKAWDNERRKLKIESERLGLTTCELRGIIPHECTYDNFLGYAHSKKRRHIQGDEISEAALVCNNVHDILEQLPESEMTVIVRGVIAARPVQP